MLLELKQRRSHGLEVFDIVLKGKRIHRFMSEAQAKTRFYQILAKLKGE